MNEMVSALSDIVMLNMQLCSLIDPWRYVKDVYDEMINEIMTLTKRDDNARDYIDKAIDALMDLMNERLDDNDTEAVELINELVDSYEHYLDNFCPKFEVEEG